MRFNKWTGRLEPEDSDFENGSVAVVMLVIIVVALVICVAQCCMH